VVTSAVERYVAVHPYGSRASLTRASIVSRPPDVADAAEAVRYASTGQGGGFDWRDYGSGVGTGIGLVLILAGVAVGAGAMHRRRVSAA
jgi:hypothetical protein